LGKLDCRSILRTMSEYIDGELGESVCKDVEDHLTTCRKCRFHVDAVKYTIKMFDEWRADDVPPDAMIRLRGRLTDETGCLFAFPVDKAMRKASAAKPARKKTSGKKTAAGKEAARKKTAGRKKTTARRKTARKKTTASKKTSRGRTTARKKTARKRTSRKKSGSRKAVREK